MSFFGLPWWAITLLCVGIFCASFMDAIGGGGGIISLPCYILTGLPIHFALGTNKLSACIGTIASTVRYVKNGYVDWILAIPSIVLAIIGSYAGTKLQLAVDEKYLKIMLLVVLPVIATIILKEKAFPEKRENMNENLRKVIIFATSLIVGMYDGFYGPGTGTFLLLSFCFFAKLDVRTASGNVKLVNLASNVGATVTSIMAGKVVLPIGLLAAVFAVLGQYIGAGLALKNGSKIVRPIILVALLLLSVKVILEVFGIV